MQIVIAHSHLNPGGVTRIIESQIESLPNETTKVLAGSCSSPEQITSRGAEIQIIEELNYLENRKYGDREAMKMLHRVHKKIRDQLPADAILHFHNLNLGKNPIVTYAVYLLAKEGVKVFNHAHDFAEDRPANYQFLREILSDIFLQRIGEVLYPQLPNYQFGVLNSYDLERLQKYGVQRERIEWLPNPVKFNISENVMDKAGTKTQICSELNLDKNKLLVTYPVRVIRRKNIGELILLSVLYSEEVNFVVTQPPKNPVEIDWYQKWTNFCKQEKIPITFEVGNKVNFEKLLTASDFCITTSYQEGFGMVYLEPWLLNTPVVGRDIKYISRDFRNDGFIFPALYKQINTPESNADFKDMDINTQMKIIAGIKSLQIEKEKIFEQNEVLKSLFQKVESKTIEKNKKIIRNKYSIEGYGTKLQNRYKKLVGQP
ncbi:glycosyltransferase [Maribellus comscasis]|uniref:Glycosyltransferase n=1 Tax=Maribellus comscasis TaxID=2681766 RepID=A0A6I6JJK9_9BACT|nr:glycosyltransferase [Maribellus comscasis]QGY42461.1 glycosyltransferase [Maribellus comscasis]